jgi:uncharacterized protein
VILASPALAAEPKFPALSGRVVDDANVLRSSTQTELTDMLAAHERATGEQVVVVTLASLQGFPIEDYGYQLGRYWGIGEKGKNTGAILIVAPKEHKVRIEVGYGLEGKLTDAISRTIIERDIVTNFRRDDFNAGVLAGTASILRVLGGNPLEMGEPVPSSGEVSNRVKSPSGLMLGTLLLPFLIPLIGITFLLYAVFTGRVRQGGYYSDSDGGFGGGSSFGGGGSSGGGGGFSGGGGSFGGGGASGSW